MKTPIYNNNNAPGSLPKDANTGLWFDKFCNQWCRDSQKSGLAAWSLKAFVEGQGRDRRDINPKLDWIRTVSRESVGTPALLSEHAGRMAALARACGGEVLHFKTASRFATGLGREHPIENGFAWHPALGTPVLPGSSVKGLVRTWAATWLETDGGSVSRIFGPRDLREVPPNIGSVIFFDALPSKPVKLGADVMTPHYGPYYERSEVPGDWHSPMPIPFLTVSPGQSFLFALAPRTLSNADRADCHTAVGWLENALLELGAGAKTAVGYGRFSAPNVANAPDASTTPPPRSKKEPNYKVGNRITVTRIPDPKGKGRIWFQADDEFSGVVTAGALPSIEIGQTVELEIASVTAGQGYNFRLPRSSPPSAKPHSDNRTTHS
jgi:CRISPR-associated protein Cmr6